MIPLRCGYKSTMTPKLGMRKRKSPKNEYFTCCPCATDVRALGA